MIPPDVRSAVRRPGSLWQTLMAVVWSFLGIRRGADHERDMSRLNPLHVVIVGLLVAAVFVMSLVLLVQWVIGSGVAAT